MFHSIKFAPSSLTLSIWPGSININRKNMYLCCLFKNNDFYKTSTIYL